ncbi:hypothetical protein HYH02_002343 [Chlamydomonas schloesseri]|uniref:Uncharacterized protein n=1 Tax=Chlamydomonas schloesseri TaxID=2026947 RepID=A0A836BAV5_9CHLO|nr:hypothetical protein HYH02_002343 [Chlamydomonas schloesseri]|eukprot:KAG2453007.1 hypothetical protein HYH02_002343 [Chlamydomonas schloesseri]
MLEPTTDNGFRIFTYTSPDAPATTCLTTAAQPSKQPLGFKACDTQTLSDTQIWKLGYCRGASGPDAMFTMQAAGGGSSLCLSVKSSASAPTFNTCDCADRSQLISITSTAASSFSSSQRRRLLQSNGPSRTAYGPLGPVSIKFTETNQCLFAPAYAHGTAAAAVGGYQPARLLGCNSRVALSSAAEGNLTSMVSPRLPTRPYRMIVDDRGACLTVQTPVGADNEVFFEKCRRNSYTKQPHDTQQFLVFRPFEATLPGNEPLPL